MINVIAFWEALLQGEHRERLVALAAQVVAENDPIRLRALLFELNDVLEESKAAERGNGKTVKNPVLEPPEDP